MRDQRTVRERPRSAIEVVSTDVPDITAPIPLAHAAVLKIRSSLRKVHTISREISKYGRTEKTRDELAAVSPFYFDPGSNTEPIALTERTDCHAIQDERSKTVGFLAFDEDFSSRSDLHCLHLSTLRDGGRAILAYTLVVIRTDGAENDYRRVGFAEVNYEWMTAGEKTLLDLV